MKTAVAMTVRSVRRRETSSWLQEVWQVVEKYQAVRQLLHQASFAVAVIHMGDAGAAEGVRN